MRLLAIVHKYPPIHNAGAEWMLHAILVDFLARGDEATVVYPGAKPYTLDGVVVGPTPRRELHALCREADVIFTHLDNTGAAVRAATIAERPIVHLVHNDRQLQFHNVKPAAGVLVVANSEWIARTIPAAYNLETCRPPVAVADYDVERAGADRITLINTTSAKGSATFYRLAELMPDRNFLGVRGAYGVQDRPRRRRPNLEIVGQTPRIARDVYSRTRILVMPSAYESWGRVAIEAGASGIPTIASPTPGLLESLGDAGTFVDRRDAEEWARAITTIDADYPAASQRARARAVELEAITRSDLDRLHARITALHATIVGASYDGPMPITSSLRAAAKCPICGKDGCACGASADAVRDGLRVFDDALPAGPTTVYRTWRGDFRYTDAGAVRAGLIPAKDDPKLPLAILRRINKAVSSEDLAAIVTAYAAASLPARAQFLEDAAGLNPRALYTELDTLVASLGAKTSAPAAANAGAVAAAASAAGVDDSVDDDFDPPSGRVGDVLAWAGDNGARLHRARDAELAGKNRATLLAELDRRLER